MVKKVCGALVCVILMVPVAEAMGAVPKSIRNRANQLEDGRFVQSVLSVPDVKSAKPRRGKPNCIQLDTNLYNCVLKATAWTGDGKVLHCIDGVNLVYKGGEENPDHPVCN